MTDEELDQLVAQAAPLTQKRIDRLVRGGPEASLLEAIMQTSRSSATLSGDGADPLDLWAGSGGPEPLPTEGLHVDPGVTRRGSRRRWLVVPMAAAAVAVLGLVARPSVEERPGQVWAAPLVALAEGSPRYLIDRPDWEVTRVDQRDPDTGEMTFAKGGEELELRWQPSAAQPDLAEDRGRSADVREPVDVGGHRGELFRYAESTDYTAVWSEGVHVLEARAAASSTDAFRSLLADLRPVGVDAWLSALPDSAVRPGNRAAAVNKMLTGIPLPPDFDVNALREGETVTDEYQLGAAVTGAVACSWIERWVQATDAGDAAGAAAAVAAMETSTEWPVLRHMDAEGDYPEVLWEHAAAMRNNGDVPAGRPMKVRESFRSALGCDQG